MERGQENEAFRGISSAIEVGGTYLFITVIHVIEIASLLVAAEVSRTSVELDVLLHHDLT